MRVDSCIFQDCAICQTKLSTQRCTCGKFVVVAAVVHGESTAALYIDDTLYHRIIQCQFSAIFNDGAEQVAYGGSGKTLLYTEGGTAIELDNATITGNGKEQQSEEMYSGAMAEQV